MDRCVGRQLTWKTEIRKWGEWACIPDCGRFDLRPELHKFRRPKRILGWSGRQWPSLSPRSAQTELKRRYRTKDRSLIANEGEENAKTNLRLSSHIQVECKVYWVNPGSLELAASRDSDYRITQSEGIPRRPCLKPKFHCKKEWILSLQSRPNGSLNHLRLKSSSSTLPPHYHCNTVINC